MQKIFYMQVTTLNNDKVFNEMRHPGGHCGGYYLSGPTREFHL